MLFQILRATALFCMAAGIFLTSMGQAGTEGISGGANPKKIDVSAIELLLQTNALKKALINYLETLPIEQIDITTEKGRIVQAAFRRVMRDGQLIKDISTPNNYVMSKTVCEEKWHACAKIGEVGGEVFFDSSGLATDYQKLTSTELMISLAAVVLHEHIHHFQNPAVDRSVNEREAYEVSAYFKLTAKTVQMEVFEWSFPSPEIESQPLAVVRYFDENDLDLKGQFVKVTKDKNYLLTYEICFPSGEQCTAISKRRLNVIEAWVQGDRKATEIVTPFYLTGAALVAVAVPIGVAAGIFAAKTIVASSLFRALVVRGWWTVSTLNSAELGVGLLGGGIGVPAGVGYTTKVLAGDSTRPAYILIADGFPNNTLVVQDKPIAELAQTIREFIDSAPTLPASKKALKEWDSNPGN